MQYCHKDTSRNGQAMIFVVLVIVVLAFVVFWNFDLHKTLYVKVLARDASDSAALAGARWQGISLDIIGELNMIQAALIAEGLANGETDFPEAEALHDLRARMSVVGPMIGFVAANQAAKNNRIYNNPSFEREVLNHAAMVREEYAQQFDPPWHYPDPGRTAWDDYADMLDAIAFQGIAAMPDNPSYYLDFADRNHALLTPEFYDAVASRNWCWFFFNQMNLLTYYQSWMDWPNLPPIVLREPINAEFFSLRLSTITTTANIDMIRALPGFEDLPDADMVFVDVAWHIYNPTDWMDWTAFFGNDFPFETPVRDAYNVLGADAAIRVATGADRITPGAPQARIMRTAAAKPFGTLPDQERIHTYSLVLPGFSDVRLIPMDTSTAPEGGATEGWGEHIREHLEPYLEFGVNALQPGCYYCTQLRTWESADFRQSGLAWIELNSQTCHVSGGPGGGGSGGTRRGH